MSASAQTASTGTLSGINAETL